MTTDLQGLARDANAAYLSGRVRPCQRNWLVDTNGDSCFACAIGAAYLYHNNYRVPGGSFSRSFALPLWAQRHYGLSPLEVEAILCGFDGYPCQRSDNGVSFEGGLAYRLGQDLAEQWQPVDFRY